MPHLASTLEMIVITDRAELMLTISIDQLQHLHALRNLHVMSLRVRFQPVTSEAAITQAIGEFSSDSPNFRRDRWPRMEFSELRETTYA